jgi:tetratricopeptide (TPR) repeat protein
LHISRVRLGSAYKKLLKIKIIIPVFFFLAVLLVPYHVTSQDVNAMIQEAEKLEDLRKENDALKLYQDVLRYQPSNIAALCKASELHSTIGSRQKEKSDKLQYFQAAKRYAESALKINPGSSDANFVMSVAMGRMALVLNGQEKIKAVIDIKRYAENAIRYDPNNYKAYHVLGKWHYEVSSLSSFERMGAKMIFGGLPPSSFQESIRNYEKSRSINPSFALNYLEVAKAYHKNDQDNKAIEVLRKLQTIPAKSYDDPRIKKEGNQLLKELSDD